MAAAWHDFGFSRCDHRPRGRFVGRPEAYGAESRHHLDRELSDYWVVTSDVRKASTVDVERQDPLDLLGCHREYRWGRACRPARTRAVNRTGFLVDARTATGSQWPSTQKAISRLAADSLS